MMSLLTVALSACSGRHRSHGTTSDDGGAGGASAPAGVSAAAGAAGSPSSGGAPSYTAAGAGGGAAGFAGSTTPSAGAAGAPHPESEYCGDAIRDPVLEECDTGASDTPDVPCTFDCRTRTIPAVTDATLGGAGGAGGAAASEPRRYLEQGRHSLAATDEAMALVFTERSSDRATVFARLSDPAGRGLELVEVSVGATPAEPADPVVAELPDDRFAVVWTELVDGTLDVALQVAWVGGVIIPPPWIANESRLGAQSQPDALWTGDRLLIAWTDGLDLRYREFSGGATPLGAETELAATAAIESCVTLARAGEAGWAAAWRAGDGGLERIRVRLGEVDWETAAFLPGAAEDRPALVALDGAHLLVLFTEGTSPEGGPATVSRLRFALLDVAEPGEVGTGEWAPMLEPYASDATLAQRRPALERVGDDWYAAWETDSPLGEAAQAELFLQRVSWSADSPDTLTMDAEEPLPVGVDTTGEQRSPALGASQLWPGGALGLAWEDRTGTLSSAVPEVLFTVRPTPFATLPVSGSAGGD